MTVPVPMLPSPISDHPTDPRGLGGLIALLRGEEVALPLAEVRVRARIAGSCCRTVVEQRFVNTLPTPVEAVHIFPLPEDGAITEVELRAGETVVRADLRERAESERIFAAARRAGKRAALLTQERADVHTLRVTNLPPGTEVTVRIVIVERLDAVDGRLRWRFPTTIAPRYMPGNPIGHDGAGAVPDTDRVPDASRIQPPLRLEGGTRLDLEVRIEGRVASVASSLHAVRLDLSDGIVVAPSGKATLDRDLILAIGANDADRTAMRAFTDGVHTLVVVEPPSTGAGIVLPRDAVFVVDISGSMSGTKMDAAKQALATALHGLMPGDRFRLVAFDDRVEQFAPDFVDYADATLKAADRWISRLDARGGTEMLPAIQTALAGATPEGRVRTVLFVTDGQAGNDAEVVAAVAGRRGKARFFTLGIDTAVNGALLKQLARVGGGVCELATPADDIEAVVARIEARFGSPLADGVVLEGGEAARPEAAVLFSGRPVTLLTTGSPAEARVTANTPSGTITLTAAPLRIDLPLGALWARERVAWLEDRLTLRPFEEEAVRPEILRIALEHRIASRFTAFVAVEVSGPISGERVEIVQPVELPAEWDEDRFLHARAVACSPSMAPRASMPAPCSPEDDAFIDACASPGPLPPRSPPRPDGVLARTQSADGSFGGDVTRTAAALLALVLLGHTRRSGLRKRTVAKAAAWLAGHASHPHAAAALAALEAAERGETPQPTAAWQDMLRDGAEGRALEAALEG